MAVLERYPVWVDVSAKIEAWGHPSVIAVANGHHRALLVQPEVKTAAARMIGGVLPVQYTLLAVLAFITVQPEFDRISSITLDRDYSGDVAERVVTRRLVEMLRRERPRLKVSAVRIANVQGSAADKLARTVYRGLRRPDGVISLVDIAAVL